MVWSNTKASESLGNPSTFIQHQEPEKHFIHLVEVSDGYHSGFPIGQLIKTVGSEAPGETQSTG